MKFIFIVTGWNCEDYVSECMHSIVSQEWYDWEAVIVDDGSEDETYAAMNAAGGDGRFTLLRNENNNGAAYSRHRAMRAVKTDATDVFILLGLDDAVAHPRVLQRIEEEYIKGAEITYGSFDYMDGKLPTPNLVPYPNHVLSNCSYRRDAWGLYPMQTFRAALALSVPDRYLKDSDGSWINNCTELALLMPVLEIANPHKIHFIQEVLYLYRHDHDMTSLKRWGRKHKSAMNSLIRKKTRLAIHATKAIRFLVVIPTYKRPEMARRLVRQLKKARGTHRMKMFLFDDDPDSIGPHMGTTRSIVAENHGRGRYWEFVNEMFGRVKAEEYTHIIMLADDMEVGPDFFERALLVWDSIDDSRKICLNLLADNRAGEPCWTPHAPYTVAFGNESVWHSQWMDMCFISDRRFLPALQYKLWPISVNRWKKDPMRSSGVGEQISWRLHDKHNLYQVTESLVTHGDHPSRMNPEERRRTSLTSR